MVKEHIYTEMVPLMLVSGLKINNMVLAQKNGLMELCMKEIMIWD
jgi:hypothetical protein